ncbi:hypothetical protein F0M18_13640 [Pseudohalioglobus sediminis]|uniref:Uncharacterized protein n=1 Tax=Pseudohalioglobus sediminis TaxID=2606449 RepID=A0A5B0WT49_9GAMM|nr:hypothetical protein [Pseudohalioglobus sediminis]KAA1190103.1 hypothetical protein F0M18_13640 [Pseudohalioglobus sediminis]
MDWLATVGLRKVGDTVNRIAGWLIVISMLGLVACSSFQDKAKLRNVAVMDASVDIERLLVEARLAIRVAAEPQSDWEALYYYGERRCLKGGPSVHQKRDEAGVVELHPTCEPLTIFEPYCKFKPEQTGGETILAGTWRVTSGHAVRVKQPAEGRAFKLSLKPEPTSGRKPAAASLLCVNPAEMQAQYGSEVTREDLVLLELMLANRIQFLQRSH